MLDTKYATAGRCWFSNPLWGCFLFLPFLKSHFMGFLFFLTFLSVPEYVFFPLGYFDSADLVSCLPLEMFRCLGNGEDESVNIQRVWENHSRKEHVGSREDGGACGNSSLLESFIICTFLHRFPSALLP